jgi:hypothetical protein
MAWKLPAAAAAVVVLVAMGGAPSHATAMGAEHGTVPTSSSHEFDEAAAILGISDAVKDALVSKLLAGEPLDSSTGAEPVSETFAVEAGYTKVRRTYADGSVSIDSVQISAPAPMGKASRSVSGCYNYQGVGTFKFEHCEVRTDQLAFSISFDMDGYKGSGGTFYGSISSVYNLQYAVRGATVSSKNLTIVKAKQTASGPAKAQATVYWSATGGLSSGTYKLSGYVDFGRVYDTSP